MKPGGESATAPTGARSRCRSTAPRADTLADLPDLHEHQVQHRPELHPLHQPGRPPGQGRRRQQRRRGRPAPDATVVHVNDSKPQRPVALDLSGFGAVPGNATVTPVTSDASGALVQGEPVAVGKDRVGGPHGAGQVGHDVPRRRGRTAWPRTPPSSRRTTSTASRASRAASPLAREPAAPPSSVPARAQASSGPSAASAARTAAGPATQLKRPTAGGSSPSSTERPSWRRQRQRRPLPRSGPCPPPATARTRSSTRQPAGSSRWAGTPPRTGRR